LGPASGGGAGRVGVESGVAGGEGGLHAPGVSLAEIRNFVAVNDWLATAGQPSEAELADVAASGFAVVVNLGLLDPRYCLADEAGTTARLGLAYHHVPVDFKAPRVEDFVRFEQVMTEAAGKRIFVHCAANYRVSCFIALYGERHLGWSSERALAHVHTVWAPDETWRDFMRTARSELASGALVAGRP
jgi:protein tyrosine phosphatase (PTP) superfamily phosphohydrolase (DUF442 family)